MATDELSVKAHPNTERSRAIANAEFSESGEPKKIYMKSIKTGGNYHDYERSNRRYAYKNP